MAERVKVTQDGSIARVHLSRPEVHNAFDAETIADVTRAFAELGKNKGIRAIILSGEGKNFCAGADVNWMKASVKFTKKQNEADALRLHKMLETIYTCPKPTVARIQGVAFGGGVGLTAVVDVAVAATDATFSLSEVKLGILPAVISPFVIRKIGVSAFRAYGLSAKKISADEAQQIGLVQQVVSPDQLDLAVSEWTRLFLQNAPEAMAVAKALSEKVSGLSLSAASKITSKTIAKARAGKEGQEGLKAFLEKRKPAWLSV